MITPPMPWRDTTTGSPFDASSPSLRVWDSGSGRVPRESLDTRENLTKQALCQVAFGQLEDEVAGMPDEAPAGLEEPLRIPGSVMI